MTITTPYYEDMSRISNSNIGWFLKKGPAFLRRMLDGKEEGLSGASLSKGTMIHMYLLQKDEFWKEYRVLDFEMPTSKQQKDFCIAYNTITDPFVLDDDRLLKAYAKAYSNKKTEAAILTEAKQIIESNKAYVNYLNEKDDRKLISFADVNMLKNIEKNVKSHKMANSLLFDVPESTEAYNEFQINWDFPRAYFDIHLDCKSLIDRVLIDHVTKKITLIDVKTTVDVHDFSHSVEMYDYGRQLAFYWLAIQWYMLNEKKLNVFEEDYTFETYIVAIENNGSNPVRAFKFKPTFVESRLDDIEYAVKELCWHTKNNQWDYFREYYEGDGSEEFKPCG